MRLELKRQQWLQQWPSSQMVGWTRILPCIDSCEMLPCLLPPLPLPTPAPTAGLLYEWLHYIVHTRWTPPAGWRGKWLREVRRHHMLHHMRNEHYWLSFSAPQGERGRRADRVRPMLAGCWEGGCTVGAVRDAAQGGASCCVEAQHVIDTQQLELA
jgi:hypothetical protein